MQIKRYEMATVTLKSSFPVYRSIMGLRKHRLKFCDSDIKDLHVYAFALCKFFDDVPV